MPNYKLHYFNLRARGELIRLIFAAAGVEYEDYRIPFKDWPNVNKTSTRTQNYIILMKEFMK